MRKNTHTGYKSYCIAYIHPKASGCFQEMGQNKTMFQNISMFTIIINLKHNNVLLKNYCYNFSSFFNRSEIIGNRIADFT